MPTQGSAWCRCSSEGFIARCHALIRFLFRGNHQQGGFESNRVPLYSSFSFFTVSTDFSCYSLETCARGTIVDPIFLVKAIDWYRKEIKIYSSCFNGFSWDTVAGKFAALVSVYYRSRLYRMSFNFQPRAEEKASEPSLGSFSEVITNENSNRFVFVATKMCENNSTSSISWFHLPKLENCVTRAELQLLPSEFDLMSPGLGKLCEQLERL